MAKFYVYESYPVTVHYRKLIEADNRASALRIAESWTEIETPEEGPFYGDPCGDPSYEVEPIFRECTICEHLHPAGWEGDCRDDDNRFTDDKLNSLFGRHGWQMEGEDR